MAGGYWEMLQRQPDLASMASQFANNFVRNQQASKQSKLQELALQRDKEKLEHEKAKLGLEQAENAQANKAKSDANVRRYVAQGLQSGSLTAEQAKAMMERRGVVADMGSPGTVSIAGERAIGAREVGVEPPAEPQEYAAELDASASAVLGPPDPTKEKELPWDPISQRIVNESNLRRGTPEFYARHAELSAEKEEREKREKAAGKESVSDLRKEFQGLPIYKETQQIATAVSKINNVSPNAAGDLMLVYGFMRAADPGSTVRETEFANAENAGGVPGTIRAIWNKAKGEGRLPETLRPLFIAEANRMYEAQLSQYNRTAERYAEFARKAGYDPDDVVFDFSPRKNERGEDESSAPTAEAPPQQPDTAGWKPPQNWKALVRAEIAAAGGDREKGLALALAKGVIDEDLRQVLLGQGAE